MLIQMVRNALDIKTIKKMILPPSLLALLMYYQTSKINLNKEEEEAYKKNQRNLSRTNNSLKQLVKIIQFWIIVD